MAQSWLSFYSYDNQEDLILKLCQKFNIKEPTARYNCYGEIDITFINGFYEYLVVLDGEKENFIIKRRRNKSNGYKDTKNYMSVAKTIKNGGWYQVIKWIAKNSNLQ